MGAFVDMSVFLAGVEVCGVTWVIVALALVVDLTADELVLEVDASVFLADVEVCDVA